MTFLSRNHHMYWLLCALLCAPLASFVACGPPAGAVPCKTVVDCLGEQRCVAGTCQDACQSERDCLGGQYCEASSGVCKEGTPPPPPRNEPPDASEPPVGQEPTPDTAPPGPRCGDGKIEGNEACDGTNLNGKDCQSEGFASGGLRCDSNCQLDTSACQASADCGNGKLDQNEECDGTNLDSKDCQSQGFTAGTLSCTAGCRFDTSGCTKDNPATCGDNKAEGTEECDGTDLKGVDCQSKGFTGGSIKCDACKFDTSGCTGTPPKKKFGEVCEKAGDCDTDLTCIVARSGDAKGYCTAECSDTKPCPTTPPGASCNLSTSSAKICGWDCSPGSNSCPPGLNCIPFSNSYICAGGDPPPPAKCGDNKTEGTEECDGTDLNKQDCKTQGFTSGTLKCGACKFDTSGCTGPPTVAGFGKACTGGTCGTGLICVNFGQGNSYCTASCSSTQPCPASKPPASCNIQLQSGGNVCGWATSSGAPPVCGNGVVDTGEDCDKTAMGATCKGLGFSGGSLTCTSSCTYDTSTCTGTSKCSLPDRHCNQSCSQIIAFSPVSGTGYNALHGAKWSWAKRSTVTFVKYAAASVDCVFPGTKPLGLGDMSESDGSTPKESNGQLRHPTGTHVNGSDMDIAYYQKNTLNNNLRAVCTHTTNGQDQYHCVSAPTLLDAEKTAFFIAKLIESNAVRVIGVDGKIGPLVATAMTKLHTDGLISKIVLDQFNAGTVTWEETDTGRGWFRFHHHHLHVSIR